MIFCIKKVEFLVLFSRLNGKKIAHCLLNDIFMLKFKNNYDIMLLHSAMFDIVLLGGLYYGCLLQL